MATNENPQYGCPFCDKTIRGPPNNPKLGERNLLTHVENSHPTEFEAFKKTPIENYIVEEAPLEKTQPNFQPLVKAPVTQEPERVVIPFPDIPEPEQWIENFLKTQGSVKDKFILFQKQRVRLTGKLPEPMDLEADLKSMESGVKNDREAQYVKFFYESALEDYLRLLEVDPDYGTRGIRMERERPQQVDYPMSRGIPLRRTREEYPVCDYPRGGSPYARGGMPSSWMEEELMRLRDDARRRDEEDRRRKDQETADLKAQIAALQQQQLTGGGGSRLEQKLEQLEIERRHMQEQYEQLKENTLLGRIQQIEAIARGGPSAEDIKAYLKETVNQYRNELLVEKNLEDMVEKKISQHAGPTQAAVEMEKARNDLALGIKKIDAEAAKTTQWGDTVTKAASALGDGIGRAMAGKTPEQQQSQQAPQQPCPYCRTPLLLPPNAHYGVCPQCKGKIEVDETGVPQKYVEPTQPSQQPLKDGSTQAVIN